MSFGKQHSFEYWLAVRITGDDESRWQAIDAIRHIGGPNESLPLLLDTLVHDTYWRARALAAHAIFDLACAIENHPLLSANVPSLATALEDRSHDVREQVMATLELLGGGAVKALDALESIANSDDPELARLAANAIQSITA